MRGRANKAILIIAFAHYDFVDNFLNSLTTRANDSHERNVVDEALFDEAV
jgi:hypothetical protein